MELPKVAKEIFETIDGENSDQEAVESVADWIVGSSNLVSFLMSAKKTLIFFNQKPKYLKPLDSILIWTL